MNFQITTTADSKLSYTPCYTQCDLIRINFDTKHYKKLFKNVKMNIVDKNELTIGDICLFKHKDTNETITGEILKIEDATWDKVLNGKECYKKYEQNNLLEKDFILQRVVHKNTIIILYGWLMNDKWKQKEQLGEIKFSCSNYNIFKY